MPHKNEENIPNGMPERPLECGECKKPITVRYSEITKSACNETSMCHDCPELQKRLHGLNAYEQTPENNPLKTGVVCGNCGTTLQSILVGNTLGCANCYELFKENIISELQNLEKIPVRGKTRKNAILHIGRARGEIVKYSPSLQLMALNEALSETLKQEDYEQAALLRDQIKALTDKSDEEPREKQ